MTSSSKLEGYEPSYDILWGLGVTTEILAILFHLLGFVAIYLNEKKSNMNGILFFLSINELILVFYNLGDKASGNVNMALKFSSLIGDFHWIPEVRSGILKISVGRTTCPRAAARDSIR